MKKSPALTATPAGVATVIRPDVPPDGAVALSAVDVAAVTGARKALNSTLLFRAVGAKSEPLIPVSVTPAVPTDGVNPAMVGALSDVTTKGLPLEADPAGLATRMGPVVAPAGTVATTCVAVDELTVAAVPLNATEFWLAVALNPVPKIVTVAPIRP